MKQSNSSSDPTLDNSQQQPDWKEVVFEIVIKILTLGFYHIKKHKG